MNKYKRTKKLVKKLSKTIKPDWMKEMIEMSNRNWKLHRDGIKETVDEMLKDNEFFFNSEDDNKLKEKNETSND